MNQKPKKEVSVKYDIDTALEILWNIRNEDKFYFISHGRDMLRNLIKQRKDNERSNKP